jgi:RNase P/RNase MRP subunit POP5
MLKRRPKRRYLYVLHSGEASDSVSKIIRRLSELFGSIAAERAAIRLVRAGANESIIMCRLDNLESVLVAIAFVDPPAVTVAMSGTIKRLKRRCNSSSDQSSKLFDKKKNNDDDS